MIRFEKTPKGNEEVDHTNITFGMDKDSQLSYVIEEFESFLRAIGFYFDGHLDIVEDELNETDNRD